ncbi:hypothetical protein V8F33_008492, partial [Rhypophila sp. PSN 637]
FDPTVLTYSSSPISPQLFRPCLSHFTSYFFAMELDGGLQLLDIPLSLCPNPIPDVPLPPQNNSGCSPSGLDTGNVSQQPEEPFQTSFMGNDTTSYLWDALMLDLPHLSPENPPINLFNALDMVNLLAQVVSDDDHFCYGLLQSESIPPHGSPFLSSPSTSFCDSFIATESGAEISTPSPASNTQDQPSYEDADDMTDQSSMQASDTNLSLERAPPSTASELESPKEPERNTQSAVHAPCEENCSQPQKQKITRRSVQRGTGSSRAGVRKRRPASTTNHRNTKKERERLGKSIMEECPLLVESVAICLEEESIEYRWNRHDKNWKSDEGVEAELFGLLEDSEEILQIRAKPRWGFSVTFRWDASSSLFEGLSPIDSARFVISKTRLANILSDPMGGY